MELPTEILWVISLVYPSVISLVIKNIITEASVSSVNPSVIILPMDLPTDKTLPINDSPTNHFRL